MFCENCVDMWIRCLRLRNLDWALNKAVVKGHSLGGTNDQWIFSSVWGDKEGEV